MDIIKKVPVQPEAIKKLSKSVTEQFQIAFMREAAYFLNEFYPDVTLGVPILVNNRLRNTVGYLEINEEHGRDVAIKICISGKALRYGCAVDTVENVVDILKGALYHELVHYALFTKGEPFRDGDPHFESELARTGAPSSGATKKAKKLTKTRLAYYIAVDKVNNRYYLHEPKNSKHNDYQYTEIQLVKT